MLTGLPIADLGLVGQRHMRDLFRGRGQTWPEAGVRTGMCAGGKLNISQRVDD
jgi:hypothetical protein